MAEVDAVLQGQVPDYGDLDKLVYMGQVVKETMRIYTPGPFAARLVEAESTLGDYTLPSGVTT